MMMKQDLQTEAIGDSDRRAGWLRWAHRGLQFEFYGVLLWIIYPVMWLVPPLDVWTFWLGWGLRFTGIAMCLGVPSGTWRAVLLAALGGMLAALAIPLLPGSPLGAAATEYAVAWAVGLVGLTLFFHFLAWLARTSGGRDACERTVGLVRSGWVCVGVVSVLAVIAARGEVRLDPDGVAFNSRGAMVMTATALVLASLLLIRIAHALHALANDLLRRKQTP